MLNLKATTPNEEIILNYLNENASESLAAKINNGKKTLTQCWNYITSEAKKLAQNGCACVEDKTVFGWAIHFFEEDSIKAEEQKPIPVKTTTTKPTPQPKAELPKQSTTIQAVQLSLFDL